MTVLRYRVLNASGAPVSGRTATLKPFTGNRYRDDDPDTPGIAATSGADGWLQWTVPLVRVNRGKAYFQIHVSGEPAPVVVTVPPNAPGTVDLGQVGTRGAEGELVPPVSQAEADKERNIPARLSAEGLSKVFAPNSAPAWAGTRAGRFDPATSIYMPPGANLIKARAALGKAAVGSALTRMVALGDSTVAGSGATRSTTSWPAQLAALLNTLGIPKAGGGLAQAGSNPADSRWVLAGGFAASIPALTAVNGYATANATTTGATATFTSEAAGSVVEIFYGDGAGGGFTYSVDGGAAVTVNHVNSQTVKRITVAGLANTTHTVVITTTGTSQVTIYGAEVRNVTGLSVANLGVGGAQSIFWTGTAWYNGISYAKSLTPALSAICLGINDRNANVAASTFRTRLTSVVTDLQLSGDVVLIVPNRISIAGAANKVTVEDPYYGAIYDVADAKLCPVIDVPDRMGTFAYADAAGVMSDIYHPNAAGYNSISRALAGLLGA